MRARDISVVPFVDCHIEPAARLFTNAYAALRSTTHLLPSQFADPAAVTPMVDNLLKDNDGAAAYVDGEFVGYLVGYSSIPGFFGRGPGVYVPVWGHGVTSPHMSADVFHALYAKMSALWVERGCHSQAISYFVDDSTRALEETLFGMGFGLQVMDGLRPMDPIAGAVDGDVDIRPATEHDMAAVQELDRKLGQHLRGAPIFLSTHPVSAEELRSEFLGDGICTLIAWQNGVAVGGIRGVRNAGPGCELFNVEGTLGVNFAYTDKPARRAGVATSLLDALLRWGRDQGMVRCAVDFEAANVTAQRFWLTHFRPMCRSVVRKVDNRM